MIDTHCHIDEEAFAPDREEVIARQQASGVEAMIVPGVNAASIGSVMELCRRHPNYCYPALGLHPEDVKANWEEELAKVEAAIRAHREELVAVGEIGLDYYWDKSPKEVQQELFRQQIRLAQKVNLPIIIHNRDATGDVVRILKEENAQTVGGIMHCFSGSVETALECIKMNFMISLGGPVTFKNARLPKMVAKEIALEHLLIETDAPYLAPHPYRGKRNEPSFVPLVAEEIARLKEMSVEEVAKATTENAIKIFKLNV